MSLIERVRECTANDADARVPFHVHGETWGLLDPLLVPHLAAFPAVFDCQPSQVAVRAALDTPARRTAAIGEVVARLQADGVLPPARGEPYPVARRVGDAPVFLVDRGAVGAFGTPSFGVHLNGFVETPRGPVLWVGRRGAERPTFPGRLDHLVAGGQPAGIGLRENLRKEAAEEAGLPAALCAEAVEVHALRYRLTDEYGFHDDTIHVFDLALPETFQPVSQDDEIASFERIEPAELVRRLATSRAFKTNVALVVIDWLLRRGLLAGHPEADRLEAELALLRSR